MRHLTASQKIAQLETRIAELEKEAIFGRKENIESTLGDLPVYEVIYVPSPDKDIDKRGLRGVDAIRYLIKVAPQSTVNEGLPYSIEYTNGAVWLNRGNLSVAVIRLMEKYEFKVSKEASLNSFKDMAFTLKKALRVSSVKKTAGFFGPSPYEKTVSKLSSPYMVRVRNGFDPSSRWQPSLGQEGAIYKAIDDLHAKKALQGGVLELSDANNHFGFILANKAFSYPPSILWVMLSKQTISVTGNIYKDSLTQHKTHMKALKERVVKYLMRKGYKVKVI
jgi:hypothetical protein